MAYEPFALKYRPRVFADLVGQEAVAATLRNAVRSGRIANAYLFAGSRGTGKTSSARILAKALNCPSQQDGEPCGRCELCESIARGGDVDVIEIDGASNRGIDEIRAIRDNAGYAPSRARFKIYIIDEVHMLTIQAFNALLKTLEEPPPHVRFIFATTEPQAVPETIVSRCQRHEFRRVRAADIARRLREICDKEGISAPEEVLLEIAARSEGGMRDSTGLLDQAVSLAGEEIRAEHLDHLLGLIDAPLLEALLGPMGAGEPAGVLDALDSAFETGRDAEEVLAQLTELFREAMVRSARGLPGGGDGRRAPLVARIREDFGLDRILLGLRLFLNTRREMKLAGEGRLQLELACLKLTRSTDLAPVRELLDRLERGGGLAPSAAGVAAGSPPSPRRPSPASPGPHSPRSPGSWGPAAPAGTAPESSPPVRPTVPPVAPAPAPAGPAASVPSAPPVEAAMPLRLEVIRAEWPKVLRTVRERRPRAGTLLEGAEPERLEAGMLAIRLPAGAGFQKQQLETGQKKVLEDVLSEVLGRPLATSWSCASGPAPSRERPSTQRVYEDPGVRKILEAFNGGIVAVDGGAGSAAASESGAQE